MAAIHWVDALYQVYITAILSVVAVVLLSGVVGDGEVGPATASDVRVHGPAIVGLLAAFAVFVGLRSGSRGGPLALERPDVRHVLLAPVDRGVALRGPAWRQLRFLAAVGAAVGATAGQLALRRLPGNPAEWMAVGAAFGVVVVGLFYGCALVASGSKLPSWAATLIGGALVLWSGADAFEGGSRVPAAPGSIVARLVVWPLRTDPLALVGPAVAAVVLLVGMRGMAGLSLEAAERRTRLVGQLRFAVTLQDLRTVLVLRRQLAQERARPRPWIRLPSGRSRVPVFRRGLQSVLRWPASRLLRVGVLAALAGMALRGVWSGTTPLVLAAGFALWVAALDAVEPMGQEVDHPSRTSSFPIERGRLFLGHLPLIALVSIGTGLTAAVVAAVPLGDPVPWVPALVTGACAGLLAAGGAVVSVIQGAPDAVDVLAMTTPEFAGGRTVIRTAWPPGLAVIGTALPLLGARAAIDKVGGDVDTSALGFSIPVIVLATLICGWVRFHDAIHEFIRTAMEQASPTKALERAAAEREAAEADESDSADGEGEDGADEREDSAKAARGNRPAHTAPARRPKPGDAPAGTQGGTSAKPIGRKRDQRAAPEEPGDDPVDDSVDESTTGPTP